MSNLLNFNVAGKIEVLVTGTKFQGNTQKFVTKVTDTTESVTKGWSLEYTPRLNSAGELYDPARTFDAIEVPNFVEIQNQVFGAAIFFSQDPEVNAEIAQGKARVRRVYEGTNRPFRITVSKQRNSFFVLLRVVDETSPFYMVALEFTVTPDKMNPTMPYLIGINQRLNPQTGVYRTFEAYFVDSKRMFIEVYKNGDVYNLGQTVFTGQTPAGYSVDRQNSSIQYIQKVDTIFKAQAFIVENSIMEYAFVVAKEQTANVQAQPQQQTQQYQFNPNFNAAPAQGFNNGFGGNQSFQQTQFNNQPNQPLYNPQQQQFNPQPQFGQQSFGQPQQPQFGQQQFGAQPQFGQQQPQFGSQQPQLAPQQQQFAQPQQQFNPQSPAPQQPAEQPNQEQAPAQQEGAQPAFDPNAAGKPGPIQVTEEDLPPALRGV